MTVEKIIKPLSPADLFDRLVEATTDADILREFVRDLAGRMDNYDIQDLFGEELEEFSTVKKAKRPTLAQAKAMYVHRYTMEHVPAWAAKTAPIDRDDPKARYYAPQFRTDAEWYANSKFPGESAYVPTGSVGRRDCFTTGQTWPLGKWLDKPYKVQS